MLLPGQHTLTRSPDPSPSSPRSIPTAGKWWLVALMLALFFLVSAVLWLGWKLTQRLKARRTARIYQDRIMSADTTSSLYPQRPIRPLPKRKLRERLAPGVAESIQYPPTPQNTTPLFQYPYPLRDDDAFAGSFAQDRTAQAERRSSRRNGVIQGSEGENAASRQGTPGSSRTALDSSGRRVPVWLVEGKYANSQHHPSAASSVDGYDSLENTNNKKKRKIPAAAEAALSAAHEALEASSGSNSNTVSDQSGEGHTDDASSMSNSYYAPGSFASGGQNIPGPGRGRYGRPRSLRVPLTPLSESTTNFIGRANKIRSSHWLPGASKFLPVSYALLPTGVKICRRISHLPFLPPLLSRSLILLPTQTRDLHLTLISKARIPASSHRPLPTQRS